MFSIRFGYWRKDSEDYKKLLQEKLILARADYVGSAAVGLQELGELESDTAANAKGLERLENSGDEMIGEGHFAAAEIGRIVQELKDLLAQLEDALQRKRKRLQLQLRVEEFRAKKQNADVWICEKLPTRLENEIKG